jgi:hypothetical protein
MLKLLLFGEFIDSVNLKQLVYEKLHLFTPLHGLGTYFQGIPIQNTVDFIWGTESGARSLPAGLAILLLQTVFHTNWFRIYEVICFIFPFLGFLFAMSLLKKIDIPTLMGSLLYSVNPWILERMLSGFWQLQIGYALLPLLIVIPMKVEQASSEKTHYVYAAISLSLIMSIVWIVQPHFLLMVGLFYVFLLIQSYKRKSLKQILYLFSFTVLFFIFINLYSILPGILFAEPLFTAPNQYFSLGAVLFNGQGSSLLHILRFSPLSYPFIEHSWTYLDYLEYIPIIVVLALFLFNRKRNWMYAMCFVIFLFLAKGLNPPYPEMSRFLYMHINFLHYFRDPPRFLGGAMLFASLSIASVSIQQTAVLLLWIKRVSGILVCLIFLFIGKTIYTTELRPGIIPTFIPPAYTHLNQALQKTIPADLRVFVLPNKHDLTGYRFYDNTHPQPSHTIFDMAVPLVRPLADSNWYPDSYANQMSAYLYTTFTTSYDAKVLSPFAIGGIILDTSIFKPQTEQDIATQSAQILQTHSDFSQVYAEGTLSLYKQKFPQSLVSTEKPIFTIGDFSTITAIHASGTTRPVILLNQTINSSLLIPQVLKDQDLVTMTPASELALTAESLRTKYSLHLLQSVWDYDKSFVNCEPEKMSYIKDFGNLFTSGECVQEQTIAPATISAHIVPGTYDVFIKALSPLSPQQLFVNIDSSTSTYDFPASPRLQWYNQGSIQISRSIDALTIRASASPLVIDDMLLVPHAVYLSKLREIEDLLHSMHHIEITDSKPNTLQTAYTATIDSVALKHPAKYLTYRFSWGKWWMSDQDSVKYISDGYGMTFIATNHPLEKVIYIPNMWYHVTLFISILTVTVGLLILVIRTARQVRGGHR